MTIYSKSLAHLPRIEFILFRLVILYQIIQHLLQAILIRLQRGDDILDCSFNKDAIDKTEALAIFR